MIWIALATGVRTIAKEFSIAQTDMLLSVSNQWALVIENARLTERLIADEKLRRELALAAEVQRRLLPARPPNCAGS